MATGGAIGKVTLREKFSRFHDYWSPNITGVLGVLCQLGRATSEFIWHDQERDDEIFLIVRRPWPATSGYERNELGAQPSWDQWVDRMR